jgi:transposase
MELHTIGIDLGKTVFHLVGLNLCGEVVVRKKFSRKQLLHFTANLQVKFIGMEACGGSHFLGRALREQGHEVRLMPAQYVKPYVKTNKSDYIDAEAIAEAVGRPKMRFVPIKSDDQLDLQSLHRVRERWVMRRTAVINQIRGLLLERRITLRQGRRHIDALPGILEDASAKLSGAVRLLLVQLKLELDHLQMRIDEADAMINKASPPSSFASSFAMRLRNLRDCSSLIPALCGSLPPRSRPPCRRRDAKSKKQTSHKLWQMWATKFTTTNCATRS